MNQLEVDDESANQLLSDVIVTSQGVVDSGVIRPSPVSGDVNTPKSHGLSLLPTDGSLHGVSRIHRSLSNNVKRLSSDGTAQSDDPSTELRGGVAEGSLASLLPHRLSPCKTSNYGTLYSPVRQKRSALSRLSFSEAVESITLTWENIDVYVPPSRSKSIIQRSLCATSADSDNVQAKHILIDGKVHISRLDVYDV